MIGIDKIILSNVQIESIDWEKFDKHPATSRKLFEKEEATRLISGIAFSRLSTGTKAQSVNLEVKMAPDKNTGSCISTERLSINPVTLLHGSNVDNISDVKELQAAINETIKKLSCDYGITVNLDQASISEMEVNINIPLKHPFDKYDKVFHFLVKALPRCYKKIASYKEDWQSTGFSAGNTQILLKFYDKLREARIVIDAPSNLLRIEYRYKCAEKIQRSLNHNSLSKLLNDFDAVKNAFVAKINKDIVEAVPKQINKLKKQHTSDLVSAMNEQPKKYIDHWLAITENIFDYELLCETLISVLQKEGRKERNNRARVSQLKETVEKRQHEEKFFGQLDMLNELLSKIEIICGKR